MVSKKIQNKLAKIEVLALDCDGVMTPAFIETGVVMTLKNSLLHKGRAYSNVFESAIFSHRDGQGIERVRQSDVGIKVVVITNQRSGYIKARCDKMGVDCVQTKNKLESLKKWLAKNAPQVSFGSVCFIGDDIGDIDVMKNVGIRITVADGDVSCKKIADYVTVRKGGEHAVREVCDLIIKAKFI